jgi:hypothetical protein
MCLGYIRIYEKKKKEKTSHIQNLESYKVIIWLLPKVKCMKNVWRIIIFLKRVQRHDLNF